MALILKGCAAAVRPRRGRAVATSTAAAGATAGSCFYGGLMLGSLATLWPWKESYDSKGVSPNLGLNQVLENFDFLYILGTIFSGFLGFILYLSLKKLEEDAK